MDDEFPWPIALLTILLAVLVLAWDWVREIPHRHNRVCNTEGHGDHPERGA